MMSFKEFYYICYCSLFLILKDVLCCPSGWTQAGSLCLTFHRKPLFWDEANSNCVSMQGHLIKVKDETENSDLVTFRLSQAQISDNVWLGLLFITGSWQWYDGKPVTWSSWKDGANATTTGSNSCASLQTSRGGGQPSVQWTATPCRLALASICQFTGGAVSPGEQQHTRVLTWRKIQTGRPYSGTGPVVTAITSPSRISCVAQCQSSVVCLSIAYNLNSKACHLGPYAESAPKHFVAV